jgi:hypothetical protein
MLRKILAIIYALISLVLMSIMVSIAAIRFIAIISSPLLVYLYGWDFGLTMFVVAAISVFSDTKNVAASVDYLLDEANRLSNN